MIIEHIYFQDSLFFQFLWLYLEDILEEWEEKEYESDEARWNEYYLDIEELVEDYKENQSIDRPDTDIQTEQKLRKLITKIIQE